jgi:hypothetical protein
MISPRFLSTATLLAAFCVCSSWGQILTVPTFGDPANVTFDVVLDFSRNVMHVKAVGKTAGWIGFGISPTGTMEGADIIIAGHTDNSTTGITGYARVFKNTELFHETMKAVTRGRLYS